MSELVGRLLDDLDACGVQLEFQEFMGAGAWVGHAPWESRGQVLALLAAGEVEHLADPHLDTRFQAEFDVRTVRLEVRFQPSAADVAAAVAVAAREVAVGGSWAAVHRPGAVDWSVRNEVEARACRLLAGAPFGADMPVGFAREATLARLLRDARPSDPWGGFASTVSVWAGVLVADPSMFTTADLLDELPAPLCITPASTRSRRRARREQGRG